MGSSSSTSRSQKIPAKKKKKSKVEDTESSSDENTDDENVQLGQTDEDNIGQSPRPPTVLKKTLIPDIAIFTDVDDHAKKAPLNVRSSVADLAEYLCSISEEPLYQVRAFYVWITHNISYDVDEYFGSKEKSPSATDSVLLSGLSVCDGYSNIMYSLCKEVDIPCKVITGYAKGFGTSPDTDFSTEFEIDHSWNTVFFKPNWYLIDCTWGAGHIDENGRFQQIFTDYYFLTNPSEFVTSHFPYIDNDFDKSKDWQLLKEPITVEEFESNVKLEPMAYALKVRPFSHLTGKLVSTRDIDILLKVAGKIKAEFTTTLYINEDGKYNEMKQCVYSYVIKKMLNVHVNPPIPGQYRLMIYGRVATRDTVDKFEKLIDYSIDYNPKEDTEYQSSVLYPLQQVQYGASWDYRDFGFRSDAERKPVYCSNTGHLLLSYRIKRGVEAVTDLLFSDSSEELSNYTMAYTNKVGMLHIEARMPFIGYYKLSIKAKRLGTETTTVWNVIESLIECTAINENLCPFPKYYSKALLENCMILEPLERDLPANTIQRFRVFAPGQEIVMVDNTKLKGKGDLFQGEVKCPKAGAKVAVYCTKSEACYLEGIYEYRVV